MYHGKVNTNFHGNKIPEDGQNFACFFLVILLNSIVKTGKNYYPQILLQEYKYSVKKKILTIAINEKIDLNNSDDDESGESNEENYLD